MHNYNDGTIGLLIYFFIYLFLCGIKCNFFAKYVNACGGLSRGVLLLTTMRIALICAIIVRIALICAIIV